MFKNINYSYPSHCWYQHYLQEVLNLYFMCFRHNILMKIFAENCLVFCGRAPPCSPAFSLHGAGFTSVQHYSPPQ